MAHVLATVGIIGAFGAGAAPPAGADLEDDIATEALTAAPPALNPIKASPMGTIVINEKLDTLLEGDHYLVLKFTGGAELTRMIPMTYQNPPRTADTAGTAGVIASLDGTTTPAVAAVDPVVGTGTGLRFFTFTAATTGDATSTPGSTGDAGAITDTTVAVTRAFRGTEGESAAVWKIVGPTVNAVNTIAIDTYIRVELGLDGAGNGYLAIPGGADDYGYELYVYEDLGDARVAARSTAPDNYVYEADGDLFSTASSLATADADISANLLTADVAHKNGPFLGFKADEDTMTDADAGTLATIMLEDDDFGDFLDTDAEALTSAVLTGADIVVTSAAGNFGFGVGAGGGDMGEYEILGDNPATEEVEDDHPLNVGGRPKAFMISSSPACMDNALVLMTADGTINPNHETTPTSSADATSGTASVTGNGPHYFCVLTTMGDKSNQVQIPEIGAEDMDAYSIAVTLKAGSDTGPEETGDGGGIERNGTTVNVTYLSLDPSYNQRLVIVNRSTRDADFWMDQFQTEEGTMISGEIRGVVMAGTRMVVDVQNVLMNNMGGQDRASGTLNLTAPTGNVDVMTVQVHPGTGQIDTTMY